MLAQLLLELRAHISVPAEKGHSTKLSGAPAPLWQQAAARCLWLGALQTCWDWW